MRLVHRCRPIRDHKQAIQVGVAVAEQTHREKGSVPFFSFPKEDKHALRRAIGGPSIVRLGG